MISKEWLVMGISASTAFVIAGGAPLTAAMLVLKDAPVPLSVWIFSAITGLMAAGQDTRAFLHLPPVEPGAK